MAHFWLRAEQRDNEARTPLTPEGAAALLDAGHQVTVEHSSNRILDITAYPDTCAREAEGSWPDAPSEAVILGLKELPADGSPLRHRHIMFGHAYKGQGAGAVLLDRFRAGGGTLLDLEYLTNDAGRRVAAFGYWAGYAGAAVSLLSLAAQPGSCPGVSAWPDKDALLRDMPKLAAEVSALIIGAKGRVGQGVADLCQACGIAPTLWDMDETAHGGPFPEILDHTLFFNCILAGPKTPVFVPRSAVSAERALRVIGDIACDPDSDYNPVPLYSEATSWAAPTVRVADSPLLDVMAIDNLPSLLPLESSLDFAGQLLPHLIQFDEDGDGVWGRARDLFVAHTAA
ncbi:saccharopine dehydrogenase [Flavimaricola marinus]|uniref:Saccharopine dehydrogenase [NAD(+), L-lysine-forming] n=1 Tax=Flavimaricola marinus TaxID=1819565 RepID=A0A238LHF3_9RHOB|nr:saccharopine dehydrogenase [Flavimaricola marinus]SMY09012.1 Alanine dehydrogenase [Flavimaricola marinus]